MKYLCELLYTIQRDGNFPTLHARNSFFFDRNSLCNLSLGQPHLFSFNCNIFSKLTRQMSCSHADQPFIQFCV